MENFFSKIVNYGLFVVLFLGVSHVFEQATMRWTAMEKRVIAAEQRLDKSGF